VAYYGYVACIQSTVSDSLVNNIRPTSVNGDKHMQLLDTKHYNTSCELASSEAAAFALILTDVQTSSLHV